MEKKDKWDDMIRTMLECFEMEPEPEDWDAIAGRLSQRKKTALMPFMRYAAAIAALFVLVAGGYYFFRRPGQNELENETASIVSRTVPDAETESQLVAADREENHPAVTGRQTAVASELSVSGKEKDEILPETLEEWPVAEKQEKEPGIKQDESKRATQTPETPTLVNDRPLLADATPSVQRRRWGFGVGGGSYSIGNAGTGSLVYSIENAGMSSLNANFKKILTLSEMREFTEIKQNVSHQRPLSFGIGIGYALDDRWTLQSGLSYSLLTSKWDVLSVNSGKAKQQLHFAGIPLGISYKIAEWRRFRFYTSLGGTAEWNISGRIKTQYYNNSGTFVNMNTESVRMKEPQFSVNGRAGVNYPLFNFLNAYLEGGADYYFKNGSSIETIRSDKPFQLSLQAGIRFGF
jgi:hypothetical protein